MKAEVAIINPIRGMIAARTEEGECVILEILGSDNIEIGDIVSNNDFYSMGSEEYYNDTKLCSISVYVQNVVGNLVQAKKQCFL